MTSKLPLKTILGCEKTEELKIQMTKLNVNSIAFGAARNACDRLLQEFDSATPDRTVVEALACLAIVEYTKNFNSENSVVFDAKIFSDHLNETSNPFGLSQREFHKVILKYRSKHVVHSAQTDINADTGWIADEQGRVQIIPFIHWHYIYEDRDFYVQLRRLCNEGVLEAERRMNSASNQIKKLIKEGNAKLYWWEVPKNKSAPNLPPRDLWGLPPRNSK